MSARLATAFKLIPVAGATFLHLHNYRVRTSCETISKLFFYKVKTQVVCSYLSVFIVPLMRVHSTMPSYPQQHQIIRFEFILDHTKNIQTKSKILKKSLELTCSNFLLNYMDVYFQHIYNNMNL